MTLFLLILLSSTCLGLLVWGLKKKERIFHYPFLASASFSGYVLPQLLGLSQVSQELPRGALEKTIFMTFLCVVACYGGYRLNKRPIIFFNYSFNYHRLRIGAAILSLGGSYFFYLISLILDDAGTQWSGIITIYVFFAQLLTIGFVIAILVFIRDRTKWSLLIVLYDLCFYLNRIIIHGRRSSAIELSLILLLALWFAFRIVPPRKFILTGMLVGILWVNSIGEYRHNVENEGVRLNNVSQIDFVGNLQEIFTGDNFKSYDLYNTVYTVEAAEITNSYDFGLSFWNRFVFQYVPAQFLGKSFKNSLMLFLPYSLESVFNKYDFKTGSTITGIGDSFQSFWYFGAIKFMIIAYICRGLFRASNQGYFASQALMMLTIKDSTLAVTHGTDSFFVPLFRILIFLIPALFFAKVRRKKIKSLNSDFIQPENIA